MKSKAKSPKGKTAASPPALDRDAKGRLITVGCTIRDDDVYGRVTHLYEGTLIFRPFPGQDLTPKHPTLYAHHDEVEVVDTPAVAVEGFGPCATKCLETALLIERIIENVREIEHLAEPDDSPLSGSNEIDSTLQDLRAAFFTGAGDAMGCADYNNRNREAAEKEGAE